MTVVEDYEDACTAKRPKDWSHLWIHHGKEQTLPFVELAARGLKSSQSRLKTLLFRLLTNSTVPLFDF